MIHNSIPEREERSSGQRFSKNVSHISRGRHERHSENMIFHQVTNVKVAPLDVFNTFVMLRIIRKLLRRRIIRRERRGSV